MEKGRRKPRTTALPQPIDAGRITGVVPSPIDPSHASKAASIRAFKPTAWKPNARTNDIPPIADAGTETVPRGSLAGAGCFDMGQMRRDAM